MELLPSARARLLAAPGFDALIRDDVGEGLPNVGPWVFLAQDGSGMPPVDVAGSGQAAVVLSADERSSLQPSRSTMRFRRLVVHVWADRSSTPPLVREDARARCERVADEVIAAFHDPGFTGGEWPGGLYIVNSQLQSELRVLDVPGQDGVVRGDLAFALAVC